MKHTCIVYRKIKGSSCFSKKRQNPSTFYIRTAWLVKGWLKQWLLPLITNITTHPLDWDKSKYLEFNFYIRFLWGKYHLAFLSIERIRQWSLDKAQWCLFMGWWKVFYQSKLHCVWSFFLHQKWLGIHRCILRCFHDGEYWRAIYLKSHLASVRLLFVTKPS